MVEVEACRVWAGLMLVPNVLSVEMTVPVDMRTNSLSLWLAVWYTRVEIGLHHQYIGGRYISILTCFLRFSLLAFYNTDNY